MMDDYPPENKGLYPPGSYGYIACELADEFDKLKAEIAKELPRWLYRIIFMFAERGE